MDSRPGRHGLVLLAVLIAAAALRFIGIDWSLPHTYEEATPLRKAIEMWGWPNTDHITLNPHFFNYPSLAFYIHFLVQGVLFVLLRVTGEIKSALDWYVLFLTDPTSQFVAARTVGAIFGTLTVFLVYRIGTLVAGTAAALLAAALMAISPLHIARSQMIEVDIPLTFFTGLALLAMIRVTQNGRTRDSLLCGIAVGLAASCKYTGAILVVPALVAHLLSPVHSATRWKRLGMGALAAGALFAATSPFVFLDWKTFRGQFAFEREHMAAGHFGSDDSATWLYYARALVRHAGVLSLLFATIGAVLMVRKQRASGALLLSFAVTYLGVIATWSMKADRYLLPVFPVVLLFAATGIAGIMSLRFLRNPGRQLLLLLVVIVIAGMSVTGIARDRQIAQHDVRTDAQDWIETHIPAGAFIVSENYSPDLLDPSFLLQLPPDVRSKAMPRWHNRPVYAVVPLPMFQVNPERSDPFYSTDNYPDADYFITTQAIRARYERDPQRFSREVSFYAELDREFPKAMEFTADGEAQLTIYRSPHHQDVFGRRSLVSGTPAIPPLPAESASRACGLYYSLGASYEYFRHRPEAISCYLSALEYGTGNEQLAIQCIIGYTRCMLAEGHRNEAMKTLDRMHESAKTASLKEMIRELIRRVQSASQE